MPRKCGEEIKRHRMMTTNGTDTDVVGPDGKHHHFDIELDGHGLIKSLTRNSL